MHPRPQLTCGKRVGCAVLMCFISDRRVKSGASVTHLGSMMKRGLGHGGDTGQTQKLLQSAKSVLSHGHCRGAKSAPLRCPSPFDMTSTFLSVVHLNFGTNLSHRALLLLSLRALPFRMLLQKHRLLRPTSLLNLNFISYSQQHRTPPSLSVSYIISDLKSTGKCFSIFNIA